MLLKRTISLLGTLSLVLAVAVPGMAQDLEGLQLFAPVEVNPYGPGAQPKEGFFFAWDGLNWYISKPDVATVGAEGLERVVFYGVRQDPDTLEFLEFATQSNSLDTGNLESFATSGDRFEIGRVCGQHGWMVSTYHLKPQTQWLYASDVVMTFDDPTGDFLLSGVIGSVPLDPEDPESEEVDVIAPLPLTFADVTARNSVTTWSVELMYIHRHKQNHHGGFFELFGGVRYMEFNETFDVDARGRTVGEVAEDDEGGEGGEADPPALQVPTILADSYWNTRADNHIIGPQIGLRWFRKHGRWMLSTEGRFLAGYNTQTIRQTSLLGEKLDPPGGTFDPLVMGATYSNSIQHIDEWSPVGELRAEVRFQCTRSVSLRAGWSGIWIGGIARPSNMVNYAVPTMGINAAYNHQDVFINGLTLGVDVNR